MQVHFQVLNIFLQFAISMFTSVVFMNGINLELYLSRMWLCTDPRAIYFEVSRKCVTQSECPQTRVFLYINMMMKPKVTWIQLYWLVSNEIAAPYLCVQLLTVPPQDHRWFVYPALLAHFPCTCQLGKHISQLILHKELWALTKEYQRRC